MAFSFSGYIGVIANGFEVRVGGISCLISFNTAKRSGSSSVDCSFTMSFQKLLLVVVLASQKSVHIFS